ncbi:MAG: hypothetical protein RL172_2441 [Bacteroidota bacterium]|jgi:hypothetical protein
MPGNGYITFMIQRYKTMATTLLLAAIIILGTAAIQPPARPYKNLQVLPQDISEKTLDSLMNTYNKALKVSCDFCHNKATDLAGLAPAGSSPLDFAGENGMKDEARHMIRLTIDINKTHFKQDSTRRPGYLMNMITCNTCHRGNPYPAHE